MKNRILNIALLSLIVVCISCNKITESIQQDIIVNDTVEFDIPVLSSTTTLTTISKIKSNLKLEDQLSNSINNFTAADIKYTKITSLNLDLDYVDSIPSLNNLGNLETIRFRIAGNSSINNLANASIPSSSKSASLSLTPTIIPDTLKSFLINPEMTYEIIIKAKTVTTLPMKVKASATYTITVSK